MHDFLTARPLFLICKRIKRLARTMPLDYMPTPSVSPLRSRSKFLRAGILLTVWYLSSSAVVILTKSLFSGLNQRLPPFPFGLTLTATNNIVAGLAATLLFGRPADFHKDSNVNRLAVIIGATTAAEIGLSNIALNLLSVSYATVLKGMAPFFVMAWGVLLGLQRLRVGLISTMLAIAVGLALAVAGEADAHTAAVSQFMHAGFIAQLVSALLSGFRWILTQIFIKAEPVGRTRMASTLNLRPLSYEISAVETIRLTAPYTLLWVLPFVIAIEGRALVLWARHASLTDLVNLITVLTVIGVCVCTLLWAEYELVKVTSSLTVSVAFVMKEIIVLFAGSMIFNDRLSRRTFIGFLIVQCGILGYGCLPREACARKHEIPSPS